LSGEKLQPVSHSDGDRARQLSLPGGWLDEEGGQVHTEHQPSYTNLFILPHSSHLSPWIQAIIWSHFLSFSAKKHSFAPTHFLSVLLEKILKFFCYRHNTLNAYSCKQLFFKSVKKRMDQK
jgi:hypothetical protein